MRRGWVSSPEYRQLIAGLKAQRETRGISQRELARRVNRPGSFINKIELMERRLDVLEFIDIALALDASPSALLEDLAKDLPPDIRL